MNVRKFNKSNYYNLGVFLIALLVFNSCNKIEDKNNESDSVNENTIWYSIADDLFDKSDSLSGVILIAEDGIVKVQKVKGYSNFLTKSLLKKNDIFELASVSKQFTAAAVMLLAQEGKLNYEDELVKYFPELPYPKVTISQMLHHTSGLPDYMKLFYDYWDKSKVAGNQEIIEYLVKYHPPMLFDPGEKYTYSNTGYVLLASIVEKVSQQDFVDFSEQRLFEPAGLTNTAIRSKDEKLALSNMAWGYIFDIDKQQYMPADSFSYTDYATYLGARKGPGRVSSNATDLMKWDNFLRENSLFTSTTLDTAYTPTTLNGGKIYPYGFGWEILQSDKGDKILKHDGSNPGYSTTFIRFPSKARTIILLTNNQPAQFEQLVQNLVDLIAE